MNLVDYTVDVVGLAADVCDSVFEEVSNLPEYSGAVAERMTVAMETAFDVIGDLPAIAGDSARLGSSYLYKVALSSGEVAQIGSDMLENSLSFAEIMNFWTDEFNALSSLLETDVLSPPACLGSKDGKVYGFGGRSGGGGSNGDWGKEFPPSYPRGGRWPRFPAPYPKSGRLIPVVIPKEPDGCAFKIVPKVGQVIQTFFVDDLYHVFFVDGVILEQESNNGTFSPSEFSSIWLFDSFAIPDEVLSVPPDGFYGVVFSQSSLPFSASFVASLYTHSFWRCVWKNQFFSYGQPFGSIDWSSSLVRAECWDCVNSSGANMMGWGNPGGHGDAYNGMTASGYGSAKTFTLAHVVFKKVGDIDDITLSTPAFAVSSRYPILSNGFSNLRGNYVKNFNVIS